MKMDSNRWLRGAGIAGLAFSALVAGVAWAADKEAPKAEKRKVVIQQGDEPAQVFEWDGDSEAPEAIRITIGPWLGVTLAEEKEAGSGAKVTSVIKDSPADKAGLKKGDVVVAMNGDKVHGPATLTEMIHAAKAGETVRFDVLRDGQKQTLSAQLAERKDQFRVLAPGFEGSWAENEEARRAVEESMRDMREQLRAMELDKLHQLGDLPRARAFAMIAGGGPRLGVELVRTTPELREHLGAPEDHGVLVGKVLADSAAEKAEIKVGDVITNVDGSDVSSAGEILEAIGDKSGQNIDLEVVRDRKVVKLRADLPKREEEDEATGPRAYRLAVPPVPPVAPVAPVPPAPAVWASSWSSI
jgi:predicted metalloprotease with PDZ domain